MTGNKRGGWMADRSFELNFLRPLKADLLWLVPDGSSEDSYLYKLADFHVPVAEHINWSVVLNEASRAGRADHTVSDWLTKLCPIGWQQQWLGRACPGHHAMSGMLFALRYLAAKHLVESGLINMYDVFVFMRTDEFYMCPFNDVIKPLDTLNTSYFMIGEEYSGVSDRVFLGGPKPFLDAANVTVDILSDPDFWVPHLRDPKLMGNPEGTIGKYMAVRFPNEYEKIYWPAFIIKTEQDNANWVKGQHVPFFDFPGYLVKYAGEYEAGKHSLACQGFDIQAFMKKVFAETPT